MIPCQRGRLATRGGWWAALGAIVALSAPSLSCHSPPEPAVRVAVAASFEGALAALVPGFERATGHRVVATPGATGKLYAQVRQGAPFDVFLAADAERPRLLEEAGIAVPGSRFTYALGRLALWTAEPGVALGPERLRSAAGPVAIANPDLAPYGVAALQTLEALGLRGAVGSRLVYGESVGQAFAFAASGAAEIGLVALSQVREHGGGSVWEVPAELHGPVEQQAVLLAGATAPEAGAELLAYLRGREAAEVLVRLGFALAAQGGPGAEAREQVGSAVLRRKAPPDPAGPRRPAAGEAA